MSEARIDASPTRDVRLGGATWTLEAGTRFVYHLELLTKRSYCLTIRRFTRHVNNPSKKRIEPFILILWALSAKHREAGRVAMELSEQDVKIGALVPQAFVDLVTLGDLAEFEAAACQMLLDAGLAKWEPIVPGEAARPSQSTPAELTGVDESLTSQLSSDSAP